MIMLRMLAITLVINLFCALPLNAQECMSMHVILNTTAGYIDESGEMTGYHYDFMSALEEASGICMHKKLLPHSRAKRNIQIGEHDGGILAHSTNLSADAEYIKKILTSETVIIPKKGLSLNKYQSLSKITIARIRRVNFGDALDNASNITFVDVPDYKHGLQLIQRGRVDAIVGNDLGLSIIIENLNMAEELNLQEKVIIGEREVWLVLSKKSKFINKAAQLREAAQSIIDKGILDNILKKYFGEHWQPQK